MSAESKAEALAFARHSEELRETKEALRRALIRLEKAKTSREELVEAVHRAAREALSGLDVPPVAPVELDMRARGTPQTAIVVLSDWQLGKVTASYSSKVAARRVEKLAAKV